MFLSHDSPNCIHYTKNIYTNVKKVKNIKKLLEKLKLLPSINVTILLTLENIYLKSVEQIINYNEELPENEQIDLEVYIDSCDKNPYKICLVI